MRRLLCLTLCVFLYQSLFVVAADSKIAAPDKATVGNLVLIDGSGAVGKVTWVVNDPDVTVFTSQKDPKQIVVSCSVAKFVKIRQQAEDNQGHSSDTIIIQFVGDDGGKTPPAPAPAPMPDVTPKPGVLPQGKFGVSQGAHDKAIAVESKDRKAEAGKFVAAFESLQNDFKSGAINPKSAQAVSGGINKACTSVSADMQKRWLPVFGSWWTSKILELWDSSQLESKDDWVQLIEETNLGLKAVK